MKPIKIKNNEGTITICNEWQLCYKMDGDIAFYFKTCRTNYVLYYDLDEKPIRYFNIIVRPTETESWFILFILGIFRKEYISMYGDEELDSAQETMDRIDSFFIKLKKLKAFL